MKHIAYTHMQAYVTHLGPHRSHHSSFLAKTCNPKKMTSCSMPVVISRFLRMILNHPPSSPPDMPKELRLQAARAAVLLLPDENREALRTLLCLLSDVTASVSENQMTPTNLAVCLAPSLFHLNTLRRKESSSPRCVCVCVCNQLVLFISLPLF